jgi:transcription initiation factor TFIIB
MMESAGLSTAIDAGGNGAALSRAQAAISANREQQRLAEGFDQIRNYGDMMRISPSMILRAQEIFRETIKLTQFKSRDRNIVISSALFFACRQASADRSIKEVIRFTGADERQVGKLNSKMKLAESIVPLLKRSRGPAMTYTKPSQFMDRFCGSLKLEAQFTAHAIDIATRMETAALLEGRNPSTLAAACILIGMFNKQRTNPQYVRSESDIARVAGVSESTVRKAYRDLQPYLHILIDSPNKPASAKRSSADDESPSLSSSPQKKMKTENSVKPESPNNDEDQDEEDEDNFDEDQVE